MKIQIPSRLREWRFILLQSGKKIPIGEMKGWAKDRENRTYAIDSPVLLDHIERGGNYGVITSETQIVLATDTVECEKAMLERLPKTFAVKSPRHKTRHFYYNCAVVNNINFKETTAGDPCCDLRRGNAYVVGAGSTLEKYGDYEVAEDLDITTINEDQIYSALNEFIESKTPLQLINELNEEKEPDEFSFPIIKLLSGQLDSMTQRGNEIFGVNPVHGSTTGQNFWVNVEKNLWYCFRHHTGGGSLQLLAVMNGLIPCECVIGKDGKTALKGELFKRTVELAVSLGYIREPPKLLKSDLDQFLINENGHIHPNLDNILMWFYCNHHFITSDDTEEIYYYKEGVYLEGEIFLKHTLEMMLGKYATKKFVDETIWHLKRKTYVPRRDFNKFTGKIPVLNGLLNIKTHEIEPFTENEIYTFKINAKFDKTKDCPIFKIKFLDKAMPNKDSQKRLQEYSGYCLYPAMPYHVFLMLHGTGRNGKGRYVMTLEFILGGENCSHVAIEELDGQHRFAVAGLYGKFINVCSEPKSTITLSTELLKKLTGEDTVEGEKKNIQKRIKWMNTAKFIILGNKYPQVDDETVGFWERVLLLGWEVQFLLGAPETIPNIERLWMDSEDEMSGILNWMLEGLDRLLSTNTFTEDKAAADQKTEFRKISDLTGAFITERTTVKTNAKKTYQPDLYNAYKTYADENEVSPVSPQKFNNRIERLPHVTKDRDNQGRYWIGIELKEVVISPNSDKSVESDKSKEVVEKALDEYEKESEKLSHPSHLSLTDPLPTVDEVEELVEKNQKIKADDVYCKLNINLEYLQKLVASTRKVAWRGTFDKPKELYLVWRGDDNEPF